MKATLIASIGLVMASAQGVSIAATPYEFGPAATWVDVLPSPEADPGAGAAPDAPAEFLLVDWQVRLAERADTYVRTATRVKNPSAIEQHSQLSISVDPAAEKLVIHGLWIQRGGVAVDQSRRARISALQRETGLEQNVVDGRLTVHVVLEDVRVGDVVDYSYTLSRVDPTGDRRAADVMQQRWTEPVARARLRLLHPHDRNVRLLDLSGGAAPVVRKTAGWVETTWDARDVPAQRYESQRPGWHALFPRVEYSEFGDWDALRAWAMPLYDAPEAATDPRLAASLEALRREPDPLQRIVDALAFVQEEIRYTGIEIGAGAFRPHAPGVVVERRYGDCKDKTLLLVTLLRATGIDAAPALVNTGMGRGVRDRLPAPGAFDHVIARVRHGGRTWWLDPTRTAQGRRLDVISQADFGAALVLAAGAEGLDTIPEPRVSEPQIDVLERFDLTRGTAVTAGLDVETRYRGASAEAMRARLRGTPASRIAEQYQDYYHGRYPGLRSAAPVSVQDDPATNELVLREKYAIDGIFAAGAEDGLETFEVEASTIAEHVAKPENPRRTSPLALAFPLNVRHRIRIALPEPWQVEAGSKRIDGPGFSYQSTIAATAREISLDYRLETRDDHVLQEDVADYLASLDKVGDDLYFRLSARSGLASSAGGGIAAAAAAALLLGLLLAVGAGWYALRMQVPDPSPVEPGSPSGLMGWMILPAIGTLLTPFMLVGALWEWRDLMQEAAFTGLGAGSAGAFGALTPKLLLLASIVVLTALVGASLVNILHLHRRHKAYPRLFVIVQWASIGASVLMLGFAWLIAVPGGEGAVQQATIGLLRDAVLAVIWTAYMRRSRRVRATFRGESPHPQAHPATSPPVGAPDSGRSWSSATSGTEPSPAADAG